MEGVWQEGRGKDRPQGGGAQGREKREERGGPSPSPPTLLLFLPGVEINDS